MTLPLVIVLGVGAWFGLMRQVPDAAGFARMTFDANVSLRETREVPLTGTAERQLEWLYTTRPAMVREADKLVVTYPPFDPMNGSLTPTPEPTKTPYEATNWADPVELPACTPRPDDPCRRVWLDNGHSDEEYWALWTPVVATVGVTPTAWYRTPVLGAERPTLDRRVLTTTEPTWEPERFLAEATQEATEELKPG